jgi:hypothetical protein
MSKIYNIDDSGLACFDGFVSKEQCQFFIDYYEKCQETGMGRIWHHPAKKHGVADDSRVTIWPPPHEQVNGNPAYVNDSEGIIQTTQLIIREFTDVFMNEIYPKYAERMHGLKSYNWTIQDSKIQKTVPGGGYHSWHTECSAIECMNRIFVVQLYLNDVDEGGETEFLSQHKRFESKQGRVVLFPGTYTHQHRGNPPLSGAKYVMNMWATYATAKRM